MITVVGDPARANARYFKKLDEINMEYRRLPPRRAAHDELARVHTPSYLSGISSGFSDEWVGLRKDLTLRANESAGSALRAATLVYREDARKVYVPNAGRPHAFIDRSDRGCVYNDLILTASWLKRRGVKPMIIDLDGLYAPATAEMAKANSIAYASIHESTPDGGDVVYGDGVVTKLPLPEFSDDADYLDQVDRVIGTMDFALPEVVVLNVGVTGHESDELTTLDLSLDGIYEAVIRISQASDEYCASRMVAFGGVASAGNDWASTIMAATTHAMGQPYLASSARRRPPRIQRED